MGFIFSKSMNENMKSQQEFMLMNSRLQVHLKEKVYVVTAVKVSVTCVSALCSP